MRSVAIIHCANMIYRHIVTRRLRDIQSLPHISLLHCAQLFPSIAISRSFCKSLSSLSAESNSTPKPDSCEDPSSSSSFSSSSSCVSDGRTSKCITTEIRTVNGHTTKTVTTILEQIPEGTRQTTIETTETFPDGTSTTSKRTYNTAKQKQVDGQHHQQAIVEMSSFSSSSSYVSDGRMGKSITTEIRTVNGHTTKTVTTTVKQIPEGTSQTTVETTKTFPDGTSTTSKKTYNTAKQEQVDGQRPQHVITERSGETSV